MTKEQEKILVEAVTMLLKWYKDLHDSCYELVKVINIIAPSVATLIKERQIEREVMMDRMTDFMVKGQKNSTM